MRERLCAVVLALVLFSSCDKIQWPTFNVEIPYSKDFASPVLDTVVALPEGGISYSTPAEMFVLDSRNKLAEHDLTDSQVSKVVLKSYIQTAREGNFDFVDTIRIFLSARDLPEIALASKNGIPKSTTELTFDCSDADLKDYFLKDTVYVRTESHFNALPNASGYRSDLVFTIGTKVNKK
jgi:hypothetical protein